MFEKCVHLFPDGRKCRRIPKRGQNLCPAHRPQLRRTRLEENDAILRDMGVYVDGLNAIPLPQLLNQTVGLLAQIRLLIDRHASRRDRLAFARATAAVGVAGDRIAEIMRGPLPNTPPQSIPATHPSTPLLPHRFAPDALARVERAEAILNSGRQIPPQELEELIRDLDSCTA